MSGTAQSPAYIRTGAPIAAGPIIVSIARAFGLEITLDQALLLVPVASFLYYVLGRAMEAYNPKLGYVLGVAKQPAYSAESAPAPNKDEDVVAVVVPADDTPEPTDNTPRDGDPDLELPQTPGSVVES